MIHSVMLVLRTGEIAHKKENVLFVKKWHTKYDIAQWKRNITSK